MNDSSQSARPLSVVLAGGGTAGHIEPALAVAEALRKAQPGIRVTALGTERGLETRLVPERGVDLSLIPAVPVPRKINKDLFTFPFRLVGALNRTRRVLKERVTAVVNVDDPHVDQAEAAVLRRDGDKSLLMAPLVHQEAACGIAR